MAERIIEALLKYKVDRGSANQVVEANRQVSAQIKASNAGIRSAYSDTLVGTFTRRLNLARGEIKGATNEAHQLAEELRASVNATRQISIQRLPSSEARTDSPRANQLSQTLTTGGRGLNQVRALFSSFEGGAQIANAVDSIGDFTGATGNLTRNLNLSTGAARLAAGGTAALAGAFIGLQIGLEVISRITEQARNNFEAAQVAQEEYYGIVGSATTAEATARLEELRRAESALALQATEDQDALDNAFRQTAETWGDGAAEALFAAGQFRSLEEAAAEANTALEANRHLQGRLTAGLEAGAFAANDATTAQEGLAEATRATTQATLDRVNQTLDRELEFYRLAETASSAAIQARIEENNVRIALLEQEIALQRQLAEQGVAGAAEAAAQLADEYRTLVNDTHRLETETSTLVQAREKEAQSTQMAARISQDYQQILQRQAQIQSQIVSTVAQENERRVSLARQTGRAEADFQRQRYLDNLDFNRGLARSDEEFLRNRQEQIETEQAALGDSRNEELDAIAQHNAEQLRSTLEHEQRLAQIHRDARDSELDAAGDLDAVALLNAQNARDRQLQEENEGYEEERQDRETAIQERLQDIQVERDQRAVAFAQRLQDEQVQHERERQEEIGAFQERLQRQDMERAIERQRAQEDEQLTRASYQRRLQELNSQLAAEGGVRRVGFAGMISDLNNMFASIRRNISGFSGGSSAAGARALQQAGISAQNLTTQQIRNLSSNVSGVKMADGGIVPGNTRVLAEFEKNRSNAEAVIPLTPQGMRNAGMGNSVQVSMGDMHFHGIAGTEQAGEELRAVIRDEFIDILRR